MVAWAYRNRAEVQRARPPVRNLAAKAFPVGVLQEIEPSPAAGVRPLLISSQQEEQVPPQVDDLKATVARLAGELAASRQESYELLEYALQEIKELRAQLAAALAHPSSGNTT